MRLHKAIYEVSKILVVTLWHNTARQVVDPLRYINTRLVADNRFQPLERFKSGPVGAVAVDVIVRVLVARCEREYFLR